MVPLRRVTRASRVRGHTAVCIPAPCRSVPCPEALTSAPRGTSARSIASQRTIDPPLHLIRISAPRLYTRAIERVRVHAEDAVFQRGGRV